MPSTRDSRSSIEPSASLSPYIDQRASTRLEYVYQAAILVAVLLLLWTVSA